MGHIHGIVIDMPKNGGNRMASWKSMATKVFLVNIFRWAGCITGYNWLLVVSTPLKNDGVRIGSSSPTGENNKNSCSSQHQAGISYTIINHF
jgi:hypothetical protein